VQGVKTIYITLCALSTALCNAAITFNLTFDNSNEAGLTWDSDQISVVTQAANEWGVLFNESYTIDVDITFTNATTEGYLGQWQGNYSAGTLVGDNIRPWENSDHEIRFNADLMDSELDHYLWWDDDTATDTVASNHWDALTVARHEFGHLLGFSGTFYGDNIQDVDEDLVWESLVDESHYFDPTGLNVLLLEDHAHIANSGVGAGDLMTSALTNGTRLDISTLDLQMLTLAYELTVVPEPATLSFATILLSLGLTQFSRRRRN
jgi:hypothetical protein